MSNVEGKVCLNHTSTPAVSRCTTCFKPICSNCIVQVNAEHFCSEACAENHIRTSADITRFKGKQKSGLFKKVIILAILGALAWFGWTRKDDIMKIINQQKQEMKSQ